MSTEKKRKRAHLQRALIYLSGLCGAAAIFFAAFKRPLWPPLQLPGWPAALLVAGGVCMLLPLLFLHRPQNGYARILSLFGLELAAAAVILAGVTVTLNWRLVSRTATEMALPDAGISKLEPVKRLYRLEEADLSGNAILRADALAQLPTLKYVDLTGNPISEAGYSALQASLPDTLILADARDAQTTELNLSGHALPGMAELKAFFARHPALQAVDCRDSSLTQAQLAQLREAFPAVRFLASVEIDGTRYDSDVPSIALSATRYEEIAAQLACFTDLRDAELSGCALTPEQYKALRARYPETALKCRIALLGETYDCAATRLDLSGKEVGEDLASALGAFEQLGEVILPETTPAVAKAVREALPGDKVSYGFMGLTIDDETQAIDLRGQALPEVETLSTLIETAPALATVRIDAPDWETGAQLAALSKEVLFLYDIQLLGQTISTDVETLDFGGARIGDDHVETLAMVLRCLPKLRQANMFSAQLSIQSMDALFDGFPDVFFGWTVRLCDRYTVRTTITAFSRLTDIEHRYSARDYYALRYCRNLEALDLQHNKLSDLTFLSYFPNLKVLLLGDNQITDIAPVGELTQLEYLELYANSITDFSPLGSLENLLDLNISDNATQNHHYVDGVEALAGLKKLERLWASKCYLTAGQMNTLRTALLECAFEFTTPNVVGNGWRNHRRWGTVKEMFTQYAYLPFE